MRSKKENFGSPQDKAGPQTWYQRVLDERTLNAPDVKKSFECLKGAFESILFNMLKIFSTQHESKRQAIFDVTYISFSNLVIDGATLGSYQ